MYFLKNKDKILATFDLVETELGYSVENVSAYADLNHFLRVSLKRWLDSRRPVRNRENIQRLAKELGIDNIKGYVDLTHALSINDALWVDNNNSLTWDKINVYNNPFNMYISKFAFDGAGLGGKVLATASPEYTTDGMLPKCWKRVNGEIKLYKGGTSGASNAGFEPDNEVLATQVAEVLNLKSYCKYSLGRYHKRVVSICNCFSNEQTGYRPVSKLTTFEDMDGLLGFIRKNPGSDVAFEMFILDALILNVDRHLNNFGYLMDNDTCNIITFAPIFDNGLGFVPYYTTRENFERYIMGITMGALGTDLVTLGKFALKQVPYMKSRLINLKTFELTNPGSGYTDDRLALMNKLLQNQIRLLLQ